MLDQEYDPFVTENDPFVQVTEPVSSYRKRAGYRIDDNGDTAWYFNCPEDYDVQVWPSAAQMR